MLKAIVVDDERRTRDILIHHLPWASFGFDSVVQAENGLDALELAHQMEPDLVLTDIMMPRMNGIQLASQIRELYPECKLIFLSAYTEKQLLKSAIQLQAVDYVEKPLDLEEIGQVVQKAASSLMEEKKLKNLDIEKWKVVMDLCHYRCDATPLRPLLNKHRFPSGGCYITVLMESESLDLEELNQSLTQYARRLGLHLISSTFRSPDPRIIAHFGFNRKEDVTKLYPALRDIHGKFPETSHPLFIAIGKTVDDMESISHSYESAERLLLRRFFVGDHCLITPDDHADSRFIFDKQLPERIFRLLQNKDTEQSLALIHDFIANLRGCDSTDISSIRNAFYSILIRLEHFVDDQLSLKPIPTDNDAESSNPYVWELVASIPTISQFQCYLERLVDGIAKRANKSNDTAAEILDYIHNNLRDHSLGVSSIAQHLYLTPSYVCSVFKKNTAKSIHPYITSKRMELAKGLLENEDILMQEAASLVGFHDPKYFTKVFKKEVGITPSEYRKKVMR